MAQGVAWAARELGVRATIVAPDTAPRAKLDAIERLGGEIIPVPHEVWWQTMVDRRYEGVDGLFVHPVEDERGDGRQRHDRPRALRGPRRLRRGDRPVGRRRADDRASRARVKALRPDVRVVTAEPETAAPLAAVARAPARRPRSSFGRRSSTARAAARCCRRCGSGRRAVDEAVAVPLDEVAEAIRLLASRARRRGRRGRARARRRAAPARPLRLHRERRQHRPRRPCADPRGLTLRRASAAPPWRRRRRCPPRTPRFRSPLRLRIDASRVDDVAGADFLRRAHLAGSSSMAVDCGMAVGSADPHLRAGDRFRRLSPAHVGVESSVLVFWAAALAFGLARRSAWTAWVRCSSQASPCSRAGR